MSNLIRLRSLQTRRKPADKPATIEELAALHQTAHYRTMIARLRAAERERSEKCRQPLRSTIERVMGELARRSKPRIYRDASKISPLDARRATFPRRSV
jgi:hypothetical protein